jgi:hypothetical protein
MKATFFCLFMTIASLCHAGPRQLVTLESMKYGAYPWTEVNVTGGVAPYLVDDGYIAVPDSTSGRFWLPYFDAEFLAVTDAANNRREFGPEYFEAPQPVWNISLGAGATPEPSSVVLLGIGALALLRWRRTV